MSTEDSFSELPDPVPGARRGTTSAQQSPAGQSAVAPAPPGAVPMAPGDQAAPGTPGTGEGTCPVCNGQGRDGAGKACPHCGGTGKVIVGIGGA
jgi:hypothetical protein